MSDIPYKIYLREDEIPSQWYNVRADMKNKPAPLVNPGTGEPMKAEDLFPVFFRERGPGGIRQWYYNYTLYFYALICHNKERERSMYYERYL